MNPATRTKNLNLVRVMVRLHGERVTVSPCGVDGEGLRREEIEEVTQHLEALREEVSAWKAWTLQRIYNWRWTKMPMAMIQLKPWRSYNE